MLYKSTGEDGEPTAVSGVILVPDGPSPDDGRKVVHIRARHGRIASSCAPSLVTNSEQQPVLVEGGPESSDAGYVLAATDYQGLRTPGPHPYSSAPREAANALGQCALPELTEAGASSDFVVWGHSQGGHASLFTGQLGQSYAPRLIWSS